MITVCHITTCHFALDTRIFYREAISLSKEGFKVYLIGVYPRREKVNGVYILSLRRYGNPLVRMSLNSIKAFFLSFSTGASIIHFHDPEFIFMGLLLKIIGKHVIYDAHEDYPNMIKIKEWIPVPLRKLLSLIFCNLEKISSFFFDFIFTPTDGLANRFNKEKTLSLYNFPTIEIVEIIKGFSKTYAERDIDLIHVGVLRKERLDFLLDVFEKLKEKNIKFKCAIIGISKELISYLKKRIGSSDNFIITENLPFLEVAELLGRAKIGINYHLMEAHLKNALPVKIFEYLISGCIVVTSPLPLLLNLFKNSNSIVFVEPLVQKYSEAIINILKYKLEVSDIEINESLLKFNWESTEKIKLMNVYRRLL
jgi:glycosyltransferase involved in cell wall biosynthesis